MVSPEGKAAMLEVVSLLRDVGAFVFALFTLVCVVWAVSRARSAHFLLDKIWRFIGGGAINDPELKKDWLQVRDLEGFRFRSGIQFNSRDTWGKTLRWLEHHDKSLNDLSFARAWISGKPWNFNEPRMRSIRAFVACVSLVTIPSLFGMTYLFAETSVILTVKGTETTFWTDGVTAEDFMLARGTPAFFVDSAACSNKKIAGLDDKDAEVICYSLEPDALPKLKGFIFEQRVFSALIGFICFVALLLSVRYAARAKMAKGFYDLYSAKHRVARDQ